MAALIVSVAGGSMDPILNFQNELILNAAHRVSIRPEGDFCVLHSLTFMCDYPLNQRYLCSYHISSNKSIDFLECCKTMERR